MPRKTLAERLAAPSPVSKPRGRPRKPRPTPAELQTRACRDLAASGWTADRIADALDLAERTVWRHLADGPVGQE